MKAHVKTLGCDSNRADTSRVKTYLKCNAVELVEPEEADLFIVMTCAFNNYMKQTNLDYIESLRKYQKPIIIGGCLSKIDPSIIDSVDFVFGPKEMDKLEEYLNLGNKVTVNDASFLRENKKIIRASTGCEGRCSYCAIKLATGSTTSRPIEKIHESIRQGLEEGITEFVFTAEDIGSWGFDIGLTLSDLIYSLEQIEEDFKVSLTTVHPKWFLLYPELFDALNSPKLEKKIYLPIQSGSDRILKTMQRDYTKQDYIGIYKKIKEKNPEMRIQCDILVGFPGEEEHDFQETLKIIKELDFSYLQVFAYTDMERTLSYRFGPKVPKELREKRAALAITEFLKKHPDEEGNLVNTNVDNIHEILA